MSACRFERELARAHAIPLASGRSPALAERQERQQLLAESCVCGRKLQAEAEFLGG